jgi:hypothetical protein
MKVEHIKKSESGLVSILETLIASIIVVISITAAGLIINAGLKISSHAQNTIQAVTYADQVYLKAAALPYHKLSLQPIGVGANLLNLSEGKTTGCNILGANFNGEQVLLSDGEHGLTYCEVKTRNNAIGTEFNVQTHVTKYSTSSEILNNNSADLLSVAGFEAKIVTVQVSWFEGELDEFGNPILKTIKSSKVFTPKTSECIKNDLGEVSCLN